MSTHRFFFLTVTVKLPGSPLTFSRSALVIISMFRCRPTPTSLGPMVHMAQSFVGKILSSWTMPPPMEVSLLQEVDPDPGLCQVEGCLHAAYASADHKSRAYLAVAAVITRHSRIHPLGRIAKL